MHVPISLYGPMDIVCLEIVTLNSYNFLCSVDSPLYCYIDRYIPNISVSHTILLLCYPDDDHLSYHLQVDVDGAA